MKRPWLFALLTLGASLVVAEAGNPAKELISKEQFFNQAIIHGDWKAVDSLLAEDLVFTESDGAVSNKADQVAQIKSGDLKMESIEMSETKVQDLGNVGVVTGKLVERGRYKNSDLNDVLRFTDVWAKRNGKWVLVAGQETRQTQPN